MHLQTRLGLTRCRPLLLERLDIYELLKYLRPNDVFTLEDSTTIHKEATEYDKRSKFVDILEVKSQRTFGIFKETLVKLGNNEDILEKINLETSQPVTEEHTKKLLCNFPMKPKNYLERTPLLEDVRNKLLELSETAGWVVISGMPGHGKTVLAAEALRCPEIAQWFPQGIFWITFGETADVRTKYMNLASLLYLDGQEKPTDHIEAQQRIVKWTSEHEEALFVMDDVWDAATASSFDMLPRALFTSRNANVLNEGNAKEVRITTGFSIEETKSLLDQFVITMSPEDLELLNDKCCGSPFMISIIGAHLRQHKDHWEYYKEFLESQRFQDIKKEESKYAYSDMFEAIGVSVKHLDEDQRNVLKVFAAFESDTFVSYEVFSIVLGRRREVIEKWLDSLECRFLVITKQEEGGEKLRYGVHDLVHAFLKDFTKTKIEELHWDILDAYKKKCGGEWHSLNVQDPYIWWNLARHFQEAGWSNEVFPLFTNLLFIATALVKIGPYAVIKQMNTYVREEDKKKPDWLCALSIFEQKASLLAGLPRDKEPMLSAITQFVLGCDHATKVYDQALKIAETSKEECFFRVINPETEPQNWKWRVQASNNIIDLNVSQKLRKIFVGSFKLHAFLFDLDSGHCILMKSVNSKNTVCLDYHEESNCLVVQGDLCLRYFQIVEGKIMLRQSFSPTSTDAKVWRVCFESDGQHVIAGFQYGRVIRYKVGCSGPAEVLFQAPVELPIYSLSVSIDGNLIAIGMESNPYYLFHKDKETKDIQKLPFLDASQMDSRRCIAFGRMQGKEVLMLTYNFEIIVLNDEHKSIKKRFPLPDIAILFAFHEEKSLIAGGDRNGTIQVWHYEDARLVLAVENRQVQRRLAFATPENASDGMMELLGAGYKGMLTCWSFDTKKVVTAVPHKIKRKALDHFFCNKDSTVKLISQDEDMNLQFKVCHEDEDKDVKVFTHETTGEVRSCALDCSENMQNVAAFAYSDGSLKVYRVKWDERYLEELVSEKPHKHPVCRVQILTTCSSVHVFTIDVAGYVSIIHVEDNEQPKTLNWRAHVCSLQCETDPYWSYIRILRENRVVTFGGDMHVKIWVWWNAEAGVSITDKSSMAPIVDLKTDEDGSYGRKDQRRLKFTVNDEETMIATFAAQEPVVKVWNLQTGKLLYTLLNKKVNEVTTCRFYPGDDGWLVTGNTIGNIDLFLVKIHNSDEPYSSYSLKQVTTNCTGLIHRLAWTTDKDILVAGCSDALNAWTFKVATPPEQKIQIEQLPLMFCPLRGSRTLTVRNKWIISMSFRGEVYVLHRVEHPIN